MHNKSTAKLLLAALALCGLVAVTQARLVALDRLRALESDTDEPAKTISLSIPNTAMDISRALGIDMEKSRLFCINGKPERWEKNTGVHPSVMTRATWCAHDDGVCCSAASFCCPSGMQCQVETASKVNCVPAEKESSQTIILNNNNKITQTKISASGGASESSGSAPAPSESSKPLMSGETKLASGAVPNAPSVSAEASAVESSEASIAAAASAGGAAAPPAPSNSLAASAAPAAPPAPSSASGSTSSSSAAASVPTPSAGTPPAQDSKAAAPPPPAKF